MVEHFGKPAAKIFILAFFAQAFAVSASATTIVAVRTKNEIVIGADSKVTDTFGGDTERRVCKIVQAGDVFFAYAGFAKDNRTGYSVAEIAREALDLKPKLSAGKKTDLMTAAVVEKLNSEIPLLKQNDFVTYREKIEGRIFLRVLVAGFEKGKPVLFVRRFRYGPTGENKIGVIVTNDDCGRKCRGETVTRFMGETAAIDNLPEETAGFWNAGLAAGVLRLIEIQIAAREEYVGPPIDVLRITAKGAEWVRKKNACPDIRPRKKR